MRRGSVAIDYRNGFRQATEHLLERGHRRIAVVLGDRRDEPSRQMLRGFDEALRAAGHRADRALVCWGRADALAGAGHVRRLLELDDPPTAAITATDLIAVGVYDALRAKNLQAGPDFAVVAFGDRLEATWLRPRLSTIDISVESLTAAVLDLLAGRVPAETVDIGGTLDIRESSLYPVGDRTQWRP